MAGYLDAIGNPYAQAAYDSTNYSQIAQMLAYQKMLEQQTAQADATRVDRSDIVTNQSFKGSGKKEEGSNTLFVLGALAAAGYAGYCIIAKKNPVNHIKKAWNWGRKLITGKGGSVSDKLKAVMTDDGLRYVIKGGTETIPANKIAEYAAKHKIDLAELSKITKDATKVDSGIFEFINNNIMGRVTFENGKISKIVDMRTKKEITDMLLSPQGETQSKYIEALKAQFDKIIKMENGYDKIKGLKELTYVNTIGDNTLKLNQIFSKAGNTITQKELITPELLDKDSVSLLAFAEKHGLKIKNLFTDDGKLPKALRLESYIYPHEIGGGNTVEFVIKNGKINGIMKDGKFLSLSEKDALAMKHLYGENVEKALSGFLKNNPNPAGATYAMAA